MSDSLLKKEFREKDVQRMRNIVQKKYGASTSKQIGYNKKTEDYSEGDIWEDNGKMWTIIRGIKQSYTKLDGIKKTIKIPLVCPNCKKRMKNKIDHKMYMIHDVCHDCVIETESKHKRDGTYDEYVKTFVSRNIESHIKEAEQFIVEFAESKMNSFVTEAGDIEEFEGDIKKDSIIEQWKKELDEMRLKIKNTNNEITRNSKEDIR